MIGYAILVALVISWMGLALWVAFYLERKNDL